MKTSASPKPDARAQEDGQQASCARPSYVFVRCAWGHDGILFHQGKPALAQFIPHSGRAA
jgi:hypothetical protein